MGILYEVSGTLGSTTAQNTNFVLILDGIYN